MHYWLVSQDRMILTWDECRMTLLMIRLMCDVFWRHHSLLFLDIVENIYPSVIGQFLKYWGIISGNFLSIRQPLSPSHWRHNDHGGVSNHKPHGCLLNRLFRRRSKKTSKLRVTGLCAGNSPGPVNSPHKGPVTRNMVPLDDVIMSALAGRPHSDASLSFDLYVCHNGAQERLLVALWQANKPAKPMRC